MSMKPRNLPVFWETVESKLGLATWGPAGMTAQCPKPECSGYHKSDLKFTIGFSDGKFAWFNCFRCGFKGASTGGVRALANLLGIKLSFEDFEVILDEGNDVEILGEVVDEEWKKGIPWPPEWLEETDEIYQASIKYLEGRGIFHVLNKVKEGKIYFTNKVLKVRGNGVFLGEYPSIVFPMHSIEGKVVGWTTRLIGSDAYGPKSRTAPGKLWKTNSILGLATIDPRRPVTIVEGPLDHLSTPNSLAMAGKNISEPQLEILARTGAKVFVFALDPSVDEKSFRDAMYKLSMMAPTSKVLSVDWQDLSDVQESYEAKHGTDIRKTWAKIFKQNMVDESEVQKMSWSKIIRDYDLDPNDLGEQKMIEIIRTTVIKGLKKD